MGNNVLFSFFLVVIVLAAGCTGAMQNTPTPPMLQTAGTPQVTLTMVTPVTVLPETTSRALPPPESSPTPRASPATTPSEDPVAMTYAGFAGEHFSLSYPASWQSANWSHECETCNSTNGGEVRTNSSVLTEKVQTFSSPDRTLSFTIRTIDTTERGFPNNERVMLQEGSDISYADTPAYILKRADVTGDDPEKTATISSFEPVYQRFGPLKAFRLEYGVVNATGLYERQGIIYLIPGHRISGMLVFSSPPEKFDAWRQAAEYMVNTVTVDSFF
jgi:hypothetical protein